MGRGRKRDRPADQQSDRPAAAEHAATKPAPPLRRNKLWLALSVVVLIAWVLYLGFVALFR